MLIDLLQSKKIKTENEKQSLKLYDELGGNEMVRALTALTTLASHIQSTVISLNNKPYKPSKTDIQEAFYHILKVLVVILTFLPQINLSFCFRMNHNKNRTKQNGPKVEYLSIRLEILVTLETSKLWSTFFRIAISLTKFLPPSTLHSNAFSLYM